MLRCQSSCSGHLWPPQNSPLSLVFDPACDTVRKQNKVTVRKNTCHTHTKEARRREGEKERNKLPSRHPYSNTRTHAQAQRNKGMAEARAAVPCRGAFPIVRVRAGQCVRPIVTRVRWTPRHAHFLQVFKLRHFPIKLSQSTHVL